MIDKKMKTAIEAKIEKSDEKLDSMTVLMLHYCAGLQHCLDQEEAERQKQADSNSSLTENDELLESGGLTQDSAADEVERILDPACKETLGGEERQRADDEAADGATNKCTELHTVQTNDAEHVSVTKNLEVNLQTSSNSGLVNISSG